MDFNFRSRQCPRKLISIFVCENRRADGGTTRLSLNRSNVRKKSLAKVSETQQNERYMQSDRQKKNKKNIFTFRRLNKILFQNKTMKCVSCLLVTLCHTTLFAIKQLEVNINANILFSKETKIITRMSKQKQKKINQRDTE